MEPGSWGTLFNARPDQVRPEAMMPTSVKIIKV